MVTHRILHIIPTLDPHGSEKQLTLLATGLPRDRFDVHVCALTRGGPFAEVIRREGVSVTVLHKRWKLDPPAFWRLKRHIVRLQPDLVHTWLFAANSYGRAAARQAGVRRVVASERCVDRWKMWHELAIDRRLARHTDRIVANGRAVRDFYVAHGLAADKFAVIPNGIASAQPSSLSRGDLLAELRLPAETKLIGAVGRLSPQKRMKELIWAMVQLSYLRDDVHLLIVGDGPLRSALERYRRLTEVEHRVHLLGLRLDVMQLMPHFDVFWLASAYEGQSNALMEAMAAGVPVVASDIPANRELVVSDQTGYLVPLSVRSAFARRTLPILEDAALARRLGDAARARMLAEFSLERMVGRHSTLYGELLQ
jgi:glycosyltransferase involved in cell wall biosynthesis